MRRGTRRWGLVQDMQALGHQVSRVGSKATGLDEGKSHMHPPLSCNGSTHAAAPSVRTRTKSRSTRQTSRRNSHGRGSSAGNHAPCTPPSPGPPRPRPLPRAPGQGTQHPLTDTHSPPSPAPGPRRPQAVLVGAAPTTYTHIPLASRAPPNTRGA